MEWWGRTT